MGTQGVPPPHSCSLLGRLAESPLNLQAKQLQLSLQVNHPEFREEDHDNETDIEEEKAEAVGLAELETLERNRHQGEDQAEAQRAGQYPHQQSVWL